MGNGVDAQVDTLRIEIETNVNETSSTNLKNITDTLARLKGILSGGWDNLDSIVTKINKLGTINQTAFTGFNQSLQTVTSGITNLQQVVATPLQTEQGRLLKEYDLVSKKIGEIESRYKYLSNVIEKTGDVSITKFESQIKSLVDLERAGAKITGAQIEGLTQEQLNLLLDIERSGTSLSKIQSEHEASASRLLKLYRQQDSITNKLAGNMQRTTQVDIASQFNEQRNAVRAVVAEYNTLAKTLGVLDPKSMSMANSISSANDKLKQLGTQLTKLDPTKLQQVNNATFKYDEVLRRIGVAQTVATKKSEELSKSIDFAGKSAGKASSTFDKLVLSIQRITFYRAVRRAIQLIAKEITTAIQNFAQFDEATNAAISGIQSSWKAFGNSIGIVVSQLINAAAPILIYILRVATNVANAISLIFATLSGQDYYSAAIEYETDYANKIKETNNLLSFDRFESLQKQEGVSPLDMFKKKDVATGWAEMSKGTLALISAIEALIALKLIDWVKEVVGGIINLVKWLRTAEGATTALKAASAALQAVGLFLLIYSITQLITKWDELSVVMKAVYIFLGVLGAAMYVFGQTGILRKIFGKKTDAAEVMSETAMARQATESLTSSTNTLTSSTDNLSNSINLLVFALSNIMGAFNNTTTGANNTNGSLMVLDITADNVSNSFQNVNTGAVSLYSTYSMLPSVIDKSTDSLRKQNAEMTKNQKTTVALNMAMGALAVGMGLLAISQMAKDWNKLSSEQKVSTGITIALTIAMTALAAAQAASAIASTYGVAAVPIAIGIGTVVAALGAVAAFASAKHFADGGIPDTQGGSAFIMNERGVPELIHENSRGQVQISNQESLENGFYRALVRYYSEHPEEEKPVTIVLPKGMSSRDIVAFTYSDFEREIRNRGGKIIYA